MKKILKITLLTIILTIVFGINYNIEAASCGITATSATAYVGDQVNINVNISDAATWNVHVSGSGISDSIVGYEPNGNNTSTKQSYSLNTSKVGTYEVSISGDITGADGTNNSVSGKTSVTIKQKPVQTNTNTNKPNTNKNTNVVVDTRNGNAYLSTLNIDNVTISPEFNTNVTNYTANIGYDINELNISAVPQSNKSKTVVDGNLDLIAGENNVTVTVTAENGYKRVYTITVTKEKNPDDIDATIESLTINNTILKNEFKPDVYEYMCEDITADVNKLDIQLQTKIPGIKYEILGNDELKQGINHITIKVTSRDGSETKEYKIIVFKTDEVLALEEVEPTIATPQKVTLLDSIKNMKYELMIIGGILLLIIIIIIVIIVVKKKNRKNKDVVNEENLNNEEEVTEEITEEVGLSEIEECEITDSNDESEDTTQEAIIEEKVEDEEIKVRKGRIANNKKDKSKKIKLNENSDIVEEIDVTLDLPNLNENDNNDNDNDNEE